MIRTDTQTANDKQEDHLVSLTLPVQMKIRSSFSAIDSGIQGVLKDKNYALVGEAFDKVHKMTIFAPDTGVGGTADQLASPRRNLVRISADHPEPT
jgi:hypothetical protein